MKIWTAKRFRDRNTYLHVGCAIEKVGMIWHGMGLSIYSKNACTHLEVSCKSERGPWDHFLRALETLFIFWHFAIVTTRAGSRLPPIVILSSRLSILDFKFRASRSQDLLFAFCHRTIEQKLPNSNDRHCFVWCVN